MTPTSSVPTSDPRSDALILCALDHASWEEVQARLLVALQARRLAPWIEPVVRIVHDLLDDALHQMHIRLLRRVMEIEVGLPFDGGDDQLEALYRSELSEHGAQNLANACRQAGWQVTAGFPADAAGPLLQLELPFQLPQQSIHNRKLIDALGFRLEIETHGAGCIIRLRPATHPLQARIPPHRMDEEENLASVRDISDQLGYGVIHFSPAGEIFAASPAMLARLHLDGTNDPLAALAAVIPPVFRNEVIWELALGEGNGAFENYRIRLHAAGSPPRAILFNVSGYRHADGSIRSLWQVVSHNEGGTLLSEGSILSEVRIHNITRNYVPQLVERKAREAVRLGKASLSNEERPVAVLFCDIVGFTAYVESNASSESTIETLNTILRRVSVSVKRNNGHIDKFMGDCIMALFDDPAEAVLAAIDMQTHADDINTLRNSAGRQALQLRIGIHWGEVVIGNVGTAERLDWTAIGDVVNTASRIEKGCTPGSVLISQDVREAIEKARPGRFSFGETFGLQVKGKRNALPVCSVALSVAG